MFVINLECVTDLVVYSNYARYINTYVQIDYVEAWINHLLFHIYAYNHKLIMRKHESILGMYFILFHMEHQFYLQKNFTHNLISYDNKATQLQIQINVLQ